jgi:hypothetical protein
MKNEKFTIEIKGATITVLPRRNYGNGRDYWKSPRMYVSVADETVFDNIANRKRRPYNVYKTLIHSTNLASVLDLNEFRWSQKAGCTMCPCSPGFVLGHQNIVDDEGNSYRYFDLWLTLENAPSVDETKPARVLVGL